MIKTISVQLEESTIEQLEKLTDKDKIKRSPFCKDCVETGIEEYIKSELGGCSVELPTPLEFGEIDEDKKLEVAKYLNDVCYHFSNLIGFKTDYGLDEINQALNTIKKHVVDCLFMSDDEKERLESEAEKYQKIINLEV